MILRCDMKFRAVALSVLLLSGCSSMTLPWESDEKADVPASASANQVDYSAIYMTEAYEIAATRATNKMLDDTAEYYESKPAGKLYIKKIVKTSDNLPDGLYNAQRAIKKIVTGSGTYTVVDKVEDADYLLESSVNELGVGEIPTIQFKMSVNNKLDQPQKAWSVIIKQMPEDKSWW